MQLYEGMYAAYGDREWWPADSAFEVAVGAVLTQNTNWLNVEKALRNLKEAQILSLEAMLETPESALAELIRPSGYYNIKAKRLYQLCLFLQQQGGLEGMATLDPTDARHQLLAVKGIGPETADDILLYALDLPVFVIDTYTRRILQRHGLAQGGEHYDDLRLGFETALGADVPLYKQYHALLVEHAKAACKKKPSCDGCCVAVSCPQHL